MNCRSRLRGGCLPRLVGRCAALSRRRRLEAGAALFATLGVDPGWLLVIIGLIAGALFVAGTLLINDPIRLVAENTALAGAAVAIGGALLVFDPVNRDEFGTGGIWARIGDNWFLWLIWLAAAAIGTFARLRMVDQATLPADK